MSEVFALVAEHELQFRQMLRALLDPAAPPTRAARRLTWIRAALADLDELPARDRDRLIAGLALLTGAESFTILKDVCGLDHDEALDVTRWAARALLAAAYSNACGPDDGRSRHGDDHDRRRVMDHRHDR